MSNKIEIRRIPSRALWGLRSPFVRVPEGSEEEKIERLATDSIYEGLLYLKRREPDLEIMSVQCIGLVTLLSGSPLD
jgi:hypothetical protein